MTGDDTVTATFSVASLGTFAQLLDAHTITPAHPQFLAVAQQLATAKAELEAALTPPADDPV